MLWSTLGSSQLVPSRRSTGVGDLPDGTIFMPERRWGMAKRTLKIVRVTYPMTGVCDSCEKSFMSRDEDSKRAEKEILAAFNVHVCDLPKSGS
jgi:hypothetical protein